MPSTSSSPRSTSPASATATAWLSRATGEPSRREQGVVGGRERRRIRALGVARGDRRLQLVRPGPPQRLGALEHPQPLVDLARVPEAAILVGEEDELAVGREPRVAPRVLQQHQRQQPERLRLVRHEHAEELREPDRLAAEVTADERRRRRSSRSPR